VTDAGPETGWIGGRRFDLFFFFGSAAIAAAAGLLALAAPILTAPLWWLWLALVDGPHLVATWQRTYFDAGERRRRKALLAGSLVLLAPGLLALATGIDLLWQAYLGFAVVWGWHHTVRQHYGILSIYGRHARSSAASRRADTWFLYVTGWGLWLVYTLAFPGRRWLPAWAWPIVTVLAAAQGLVLAAYAVSIVRRRRRGESARPAWFVLAQAFGLTAFAYFVIGPFEPLYAGALTYEQQILAVAVVIGTVHGLQYLGIVTAVTRRRHPRRSPWLAYAVCVTLSLGYLALNAARGEGPVVAWYAPSTLGAKLFLAVYWGMFMHHYYLDQKIWRPHRDPELRAELGLT
jgi:hypothetical protein